MKVKTVEEVKQLYDIVYDLPDELVDEFDKIRERGGLNSIREFLNKNAKVVSSVQRDGSYDFKLFRFEYEKGEDE